jgi:phosphoribosylamine--glycine ligase
MKVLIIGQGGREHALVKALKDGPSVKEIHVIPGNPGIATDVVCHSLDYKNNEVILKFCKRTEIDLVIIGPEDPIVEGLADELRAAKIPVVAPSQLASKLEGSKVFAKDFMFEYGVASSNYVVVNSVDETLDAAKLFMPPYVLKADGLCGGKGVSICKTVEQLRDAADMMFNQKIFGAAAERAILEQYLPGYELSFLVLTNGESYQALPLAQDHKQLYDYDEGPNTGGMGTIAPIEIPENLRSLILARIVEPTLRGLKHRDYMYRGVIFFGVMVTLKGPMCLEYNIRFGDPETQVILPLLDGDWGEVFANLAEGNVQELKWKPLHSCCVVMAAPGYPEKPLKGLAIEGDINYQTDYSYFLHAGTHKNPEGKWTTNGGRVMCSVGLGINKEQARHRAYEQATKITWLNVHMRKDIGLRKN